MNRRIQHHRPDRCEISHTHGPGDLCGCPANTRQSGEITHDVMRCVCTQPRDQLVPTFLVTAQQYQSISIGFGEETGQC
ncbi:Uncharacterised protein [Mycobacteroides abscessus subsp. abscessus]|nr:Uncharacterised protein [Mycobacteroides abscessus subsp. abscessus]